MDKITFLNELETELDDLPRKEKDKVMNEYEDIFYNQETKGKTDAQILDDLKNPYTIGKEIKAKEAISHAKVTPNFRNIVKAIMASLSLGVISFFFNCYPNYNILNISSLCFRHFNCAYLFTYLINYY